MKEIVAIVGLMLIMTSALGTLAVTLKMTKSYYDNLEGLKKGDTEALKNVLDNVTDVLIDEAVSGVTEEPLTIILEDIAKD